MKKCLKWQGKFRVTINLPIIFHPFYRQFSIKFFEAKNYVKIQDYQNTDFSAFSLTLTNFSQRVSSQSLFTFFECRHVRVIVSFSGLENG